DDHAVGARGEHVLQGAAVQLELTGTLAESNPGHGLLSPAGAQIRGLRLFRHLATPCSRDWSDGNASGPRRPRCPRPWPGPSFRRTPWAWPKTPWAWPKPPSASRTTSTSRTPWPWRPAAWEPAWVPGGAAEP